MFATENIVTFSCGPRRVTFVNELCKISTFGRHMLRKRNYFFRNGVLPEIFGKCITRVPKVTVYDNNDGSDFATVRGKSLGEMCPCSRAECQLKYFHFECLKKKAGYVLIVET